MNRRVTHLTAIAGPIVAIIFIVLILDPSPFTVAPQPTDPFFYFGLSIDPTILDYGPGLEHYAISRWTLYLPQHVFYTFLGLTIGRLLFKSLLMTTWIYAAKKWHNVNPQVSSIAIFAALLNPTFWVILADEYAVSIGLWALVLTIFIQTSTASKQTAHDGFYCGALGAVALIANPAYGFYALVISVSFSSFDLLRRIRVRKILLFWTRYLLSFVTVILSGHFVMKSRFGFDNIYRPTVAYVLRELREGSSFSTPLALTELLKLSWVWLTPASLLLLALFSRKENDLRERAILFDRNLKIMFAASILYLYTFAQQVILQSPAMDYFFYSSLLASFVIPSLFFIFKYSDLPTASGFRYTVAMLLPLHLAISQFEMSEKLNGWAPSALALILVLALIFKLKVGFICSRLRVKSNLQKDRLSVSKSGIFLSCSTLLLTSISLTPFTANPNEKPLDPSLNSVYGGEISQVSNRMLQNSLSLLDFLDERGLNDGNTYFLANGESSAYIGIVGAHLTKRRLRPGSGALISEPYLAKIRSGQVERILITGDEETFVGASRFLNSAGIYFTLVESGRLSGGDSYFLIRPSGLSEGDVYPAAILPGKVGLVDGKSRHVSNTDDDRGWIIADPTWELEGGNYDFFIDLSCETNEVSAVAGMIEIYSVSNSNLVLQDDLLCSDSTGHTFMVPSENSSTRFGLRVFWFGQISLSVHRVSMIPNLTN